MKLSNFEKLVLKMIKKIPRGRVATYKKVAQAIGRPKAARAVGNALGKNPNAPRIPCHRVVKSNGGIGGYAKGVARKIKFLSEEGIRMEKGKVVDFQEILYKFDNNQ